MDMKICLPLGGFFAVGGFPGSHEKQGERGEYMYDYVLPVSNKDMINIAKRAFNLMDARLMGHGERTAYIMLQLMKAEGTYTPLEFRNLLILTVLHDIGAYKTEEIDKMMEFETENVWGHSLYGYLFFHYFSMFTTMSQVVLYHHTPWWMLLKLEHVSDRMKKTAQLLSLSDCLDIYLEQAGDGKEMEAFFTYLEQERDRMFSGEVIDLLRTVGLIHPTTGYIDLEQQYDAILETVPFTEDERESILRMVIYAIDFRSPHTVTHTITTAVISSELAKRLCKSQSVVTEVFCGAILHDLGKMGIPVEILENPGKLDGQDMEVMKTHVDLTEYILGDSVSITVKNIALRHHEKLDGSGYPRGLKAEALDIPQRIVAVADIVSALTGTRSYKEGFSKEKTIRSITSMAEKGMLDQSIVGLMTESYDAIMDSVQEIALPVLKNYQEMQDHYTCMLSRMEKYEDGL